jgi:hypothetical protein
LSQLFEWALKQPPAPDFEGAKQDKKEVADIFQELDKECTKPIL